MQLSGTAIDLAVKIWPRSSRLSITEWPKINAPELQGEIGKQMTNVKFYWRLSHSSDAVLHTIPHSIVRSSLHPMSQKGCWNTAANVLCPLSQIFKEIAHAILSRFSCFKWAFDGWPEIFGLIRYSRDWERRTMKWRKFISFIIVLFCTIRFNCNCMDFKVNQPDRFDKVLMCFKLYGEINAAVVILQETSIELQFYPKHVNLFTSHKLVTKSNWHRPCCKKSV